MYAINIYPKKAKVIMYKVYFILIVNTADVMWCGGIFQRWNKIECRIVRYDL